jgi:hypothetical protein
MPDNSLIASPAPRFIPGQPRRRAV